MQCHSVTRSTCSTSLRRAPPRRCSSKKLNLGLLAISCSTTSALTSRGRFPMAAQQFLCSVSLARLGCLAAQIELLKIRGISLVALNGIIATSDSFSLGDISRSVEFEPFKILDGLIIHGSFSRHSLEIVVIPHGPSPTLMRRSSLRDFISTTETSFDAPFAV